MSLEIRPVDAKNRGQALKMKVHPSQEGFIESVAECLSEADALNSWRPVLLYDGGRAVGFAMYGFFPKEGEKGRVWLDRMLIDRRYQGRGYGKAAMHALIDRLTEEYRCDRIYLSLYEDNERALSLYRAFGFYFTGEVDTKGEKVMSLRIEYD